MARGAIIGAIGEARWQDLRCRAGRISRNEYYDRLTELIISRVLSADAVCLDVGCHVGDILRLMMYYAPAGRFVAFEPLPLYYESLCRNFPGVTVLDCALSDTQGATSFQFVETNPGYSGLKKRRYDRATERITQISVEQRTLDSVVADLGLDRLDFLKIDVEGAELMVLKGAVETLRDSNRLLFSSMAWVPPTTMDMGPRTSRHFLIPAGCASLP